MERQVKSHALTMRVMKYAVVGSALLLAFVAIKVSVQPGPPVSHQFQLIIAFLGLMSLAAGFLVPPLVAQTAQRTVQRGSAEAQLQLWTMKGVLSLAFFEACILFGLMLHFLHGSVRLVGFLFAAGMVAELIWNPGEPPGTRSDGFPQG